MPTIALSTINVLVPEITKILVRSVEAWDFEEYRIKQEIWRNFSIKFINLTIFVVVSFDGFYDISFLNETLGTQFASGTGRGQGKDQGECKYDKVAVALFQLVITELAVLVVAQIGAAAFNRVFRGMILRKPEWRHERAKYLSNFVIWMLYNKAVMWLLILEMPYFVLFAPIVDYVSF